MEEGRGKEGVHDQNPIQRTPARLATLRAPLQALPTGLATQLLGKLKCQWGQGRTQQAGDKPKAIQGRKDSNSSHQRCS